MILATYKENLQAPPTGGRSPEGPFVPPDEGPRPARPPERGGGRRGRPRDDVADDQLRTEL